MKILMMLAFLFLLLNSTVLADDCQMAILEQNLDVNISCVEMNGQLLRVRLKSVEQSTLGKVPPGMYWQSQEFEPINCQPVSSICATIDEHLNLRLPIEIDTVPSIAHLEHYSIAHLQGDYWKYRYHYPTTPVTTTEPDLKSKVLTNEVAYIAPQCYTKTVDAQGQAHNPCFTCHQQGIPPNYNNDDDLQVSYAFPDYALTNHWTNLFKDRTQQVAAINDETVLAYVRIDNYQDETGQLILVNTLRNVPSAWDYNNNGRWDGFTPDCYFHFDAEGFDRAPSGQYTGWRAFAYHLFPGTFWPTNGSTDDVLIRLPIAFQQNEAGQFDKVVYQTNLAIVEALIKRQDIEISPVDEQQYGVDLDKDGQLATANKIVYRWAPREGQYMSYVGQAKQELATGKQYLAAGLFPLDTEFLHSVRYIDMDDTGQIKLAARMKELRYARKADWRT